MGILFCKPKIPFDELNKEINKIMKKEISTEQKMNQILDFLDTFLLERCKDFLLVKCEDKDIKENNKLSGRIKYTDLEKYVQKVFLFPNALFERDLTDVEIDYYQFLRYLHVNPTFAEEQNIPPHCSYEYLCLQIGNPLLYADFIMSLTMAVENNDQEKVKITILNKEKPVSKVVHLIISQIPVTAKVNDYDYSWRYIQKKL